MLCWCSGHAWGSAGCTVSLGGCCPVALWWCGAPLWLVLCLVWTQGSWTGWGTRSWTMPRADTLLALAEHPLRIHASPSSDPLLVPQLGAASPAPGGFLLHWQSVPACPQGSGAGVFLALLPCRWVAEVRQLQGQSLEVRGCCYCSSWPWRTEN